MVASHITSSIRKQKKRFTLYSAFFFLFSQNPSPWHDTEQAMCVFSLQFTQSRNSYENVQKFVYWMILDPANLIMITISQQMYVSSFPTVVYRNALP